MINLQQRHREPEIMDQPGLDHARHVQALRGLERINFVSGSMRILWPAIAGAAKSVGKPLRILDLATGAGDLPIRLWHKARRSGLSVEVAGCDRSGTAIEHAHLQSERKGAVVQFFVLDVLQDPLPTDYDVLTCSLFLHHLDENEAVTLLRRMAEAAGRLVLVNDLARSRLGYLLAYAGTRVLSRSAVVHTDGPLSVAAAFTIPEAKVLAERAGMVGATIEKALAMPISVILEEMSIAPTPLKLADAANQVWDVAVVGAGPAGALAAHELARRGCKVLLVDKASFPRNKVCGCCLNGLALRTLESAGLGDLPAQASAVRLKEMRLTAAGCHARLPLPVGVALSRAVFDTALVTAAVQAGAVLLPETEAIAATAAADGRTLTLRQGSEKLEVQTRILLAADGLGGRLLAGESESVAPADSGSWIGAGAITEQAVGFYVEGTIYMACGNGGYVGAVRLEDGRLDVAAALDPAYVRQAGGLGSAVAGILSQTGWPAIAGLDALPWRGTPALTRRARRVASERAFVIGDAASYVEPFTGEGMAWALASAAAVAALAARAVDSWQPSLAHEWTNLHRRMVLNRQRNCRILTSVLHHTMLTRILIHVLALLPGLATPFIRRLNDMPGRS